MARFGVQAKRVCGALLALTAPWCATGQNMMRSGSSGSLVGSDLAVLESREVRRDLPCVVTPVKPMLGFDMRFHSGFEISVPLRELAGAENLLNIVFRVTPDGDRSRQYYFSQKFRVPSLEEDSRGEAFLQGYFDTGEGKYHIDWLMRDRGERVCANNWEIEAALPARDRTLSVDLPAGEVAASVVEQFADEPPVERVVTASPVNVKVVVNFAPQNSNASALQPMDTSALVSILRYISRDPRIARFSVVAFNLQEERVIYRQESADRIDFPAIGEALKSLQLGRVDYARLAQKNSETEFLAKLIRDELGGAEQPDALIFAGPKVLLAENVPAEVWKEAGEPAYPVFYMNYNLTPQATPWRDAIGNAVRQVKGSEYTITRPRDLWFAVTEVLGKIVKWKEGKRTNSAAFH